MRFLDDLSLGRKLVIIITGISGTALLIACLLVISYDIHRFRVNQIEQLSLLADVLGTEQRRRHGVQRPASCIRDPHLFAIRLSVMGICLYLNDGSAFARFARDPAWTCDFAASARRSDSHLRRADAGAAGGGERRTRWEPWWCTRT